MYQIHVSYLPVAFTLPSHSSYGYLQMMGEYLLLMSESTVSSYWAMTGFCCPPEMTPDLENTST